MLRRDLISGALTLRVAREKLDQAIRLLERAAASGDVAAAALYVSQGETTTSRAFGRARNPETVFLLASITKPMTATGVMVLADRGGLSLSDPVRKFIPEFTGGDRDLVTVRHLLTHT